METLLDQFWLYVQIGSPFLAFCFFDVVLFTIAANQAIRSDRWREWQSIRGRLVIPGSGFYLHRRFR